MVGGFVPLGVVTHTTLALKGEPIHAIEGGSVAVLFELGSTLAWLLPLLTDFYPGFSGTVGLGQRASGRLPDSGPEVVETKAHSASVLSSERS
jgi:hypothetical protein